MFTVALLGNTAAQAARLSEQLPFAHRILTSGDEPGERVDAMVSLRFGEDEARWQPRLLHMPGAGVDAVDFTQVPDDCAVCNVFEHEGPIAEYVMLAMLDWEIGFSAMTQAFTAEAWSEAYRNRRPHGELAGKTVGLLGYGHIGQAIADRAASFGLRVVAVASRARPTNTPLASIGGPEHLDAMLGEVDYLVIACPLTDATRGLLDRRRLALLKPTAVLINVARGEIIDEAALFEALQEQRLGGAVLDAWFRYPGPGETVPPSRFPFAELANVRATPHASAWTAALFARRYAVIADNIRRFHAGEPLRNVVRAALRQEAVPCLT